MLIEVHADGFFAWNPLWLPIGSDTCGAYLIIDHEPGAALGRATTSYAEDFPNMEDSWINLREALTNTFEAMRHGTPFRHHRCTVVNDRLVWRGDN